MILSALTSCFSVRPVKDFNPNDIPPAPDYALLEYWAAHPDKKDPADLSPGPESPDLQQDAAVDVLFFHPTTYTGDRRSERAWNVAASDRPTNKKTDESTIQYQASLFNGAGRVFAPRYRQAHLHVFYTKKDSASARQALDLAYADSKAAFEYYLKHWNNGRPFILAGHSQGARHLMYLLRDMVEGKDLERQLVAAYVVGWPVKNDFFRQLKPCETPEETGCYCTWRTWKRRFGRRNAFETEVVCTNPLSWTIREGEYAGKDQNKGAVIRPFHKIYPAATDAEVYKGILLANKPTFRGSIFFIRKNFHIGDLNLYYMNVRENAQARARSFLRH